jgi:hypothetical protein
VCGASLWAFQGAPLAPHTEEEDRKRTRRSDEDGDANLQNIRDLTARNKKLKNDIPTNGRATISFESFEYNQSGPQHLAA